MEKAMYPSKYIRITQKDHEGTHSACWAVDEAGVDGGISNFIMPFDGIVKKIYKADANEVWIESKEKVEYPDGTIDYMTIMFAHDNDVSDLWVGKEIKAGTIFYQEGTKGEAYGNHVHFEVGKGKFTGSGWYQDASGAWSIINGKKVTDCLWIDDTYQIIDTKGYKFKNVKEAEMKKLGTPVARDEYKDQVKIKDGMTTVRARNKANGDILGYMNIGLYNILEYANDGGYTWYKVEKDLWFAYSSEWCEALPKKEKPVEPPVEPPVVEPETPINEELQKEIDNLKEENAELKKQLADQPTKIFTCESDCIIQYKMLKGEELYTKKLG